MSQHLPSFAPTVASLVELLRERTASRPGQRAYTFLEDGEAEADSLTYAELDRRARAIGALLQRTVAPGSRALLLLPPGLDFIAAFFGCLYGGVVAVPAYPPRLSKGLAKLRSIVGDCQPAVALTTAAIAARVSRWSEEEASFGAVRWMALDSIGPAEEDAEADAWRDPGVDGSTVAFLQYTSGSTGDPKGVVVSHGNLLHNEAAIQHVFRQTERSVIVGWLPLYHDMGLIGTVLQPLWAGATCVLMAPAAFLQKPARWLQAISRYRGTTSGGPNFAYDLCVRKISAEQREGLDLRSWQVAFNGAEPIHAETLERFAAAFAPYGFDRRAFCPCYGLAEATLLVSGVVQPDLPLTRHLDAEALTGHLAVDAAAEEGGRPMVGSGRPLPDQRLVVVDPETLAPCEPGRVGEVWVQGPSVALGYWQRPEQTAQTFGAHLASGEGAFLRTGDLGFLDGTGELFLTGRLKDLVIIRGRNHYPQDIELTAERSHPALRPGSGAAFAVEVDGEERLVVVQEVERRAEGQGMAAAEAVRRAVTEEHEVQVHDVVLIPAGTIPKTTSGKIRRGACRDLWLQGALGVVGRSTQAPTAASPSPSAALALTRAGLLAAEPEERLALLESHLRERVAAALRLPAEQVDPRQPPGALGLDSLASVELQHALETAFGISLPLPVLLEAGSLERIAVEILGRVEEEAEDELLQAAELEAPGTELPLFPLSRGQRALWFLERLAPGNGAYNIAVAARVGSGFDAAALERALRTLAGRHAALRTTFGESGGEPWQRVQPEADVALALALARADARGWSQGQVEAWTAAEAFRPFDLAEGPLLRAALLDGEDGGILVVAVHHLVADFWSLAILVRELSALYREERGGAPAALPALPVSYAGWVRWQERRLAGPVGERGWDYWRRQLADAPHALELPLDRPRPPVQTWAGAASRFRLPAELAAGLHALARENRATPYMVLLAGFQALLHRYTGQDDFLVGSPSHGRNAAALAGLVGYFVNPLALRADLSAEPSFAALLGRTRQTVLGALEHQEIPFPLLAERLQPERDPSRSPLFQVLFVLQRAQRPEEAALGAFALGEPGVRLDAEGLGLTSLPLPERRAQFDLTLALAELDGDFAGALEHNTDLFDPATAARLAAHLAVLLRGAAADPSRPVGLLPLLAEGEREQLLRVWGEAEPAEGEELCLHEMFAAQARHTPEAPALVFAGDSLTYRELAERASRLAARLRRLGVGPEVRVALCSERTPEMVVGLLAVLEAGGAYVPLDPAYPEQRLAWTLADSGAAVLLTREHLLDRLPAGKARVVLLDEAGLEVEEGDVAPRSGPRNLAYVIYTSGSTGLPKGVAIEHRSAAALVHWARRAFSAEERAAVLASTSICFDLSVFELFVPLCSGGRVVLAANALELPALAGAGVTLVNTVPSAAAELARGDGLPPSVRVVNLAGEPLQRWLVDRLHERLPGCRVLNLYGPSEDTTYSTGAEALAGDRREPTIGRPLPGTRSWVLDAHLSPVPAGVAGELYLGGAGLARGYLGRPELTAERFVPNPWSTDAGDAGARLYRTGDLARWRADGELEFLGRADHQVKVRGFRIELGEVEAALAQHPEVREVAVGALPEPSGGLRLVAWVAAGPSGIGREELAAFLAERLPGYMVPTGWSLLAALPRTPNGKLDRKALPLPGAGEPALRVAPRTPLEELVAGLWSEVLGVESVGVHDRFFDLGGHSLLATRVVSRLRQSLGVEIPLRRLFEAPTVAALARDVEAARASGAAIELPPILPLRPVARDRGLPLSYAQQRLWFLHQLDPGSAAYHLPGVLHLRGPLDVDALARALAAIVQRHEALRTTFADGPVQTVANVAGMAAAGLPVIDLRGCADSEAEAGRRLQDLARQPFDLTRGPLLRAVLLRLDEQEHRLGVCLHHIVADGWSLGVLWRELSVLYTAFRQGTPPALPELPVQYADFAVWQRQLLRGPALAAGLDFWRRELAGEAELPVLQLPADRPRPAVRTTQGGRLPLRWPAGLTADLERLRREQGVTLFMALLAAFQALLGRYSGQPDFAVGSPVAGRDRIETEGLIGCFVNTLVLRAGVDTAAPFTSHLARTRETVLAAFGHQEIPFELLVEELRPERSLSHGALFQVFFAFQQDALPDAGLPGLRADLSALDNGTAKFDLTLSLDRDGTSLAGYMEHSADLFDPATAARMAAHLEVLLREAVADPSRPVGLLPLLAEGERQQLLRQWGEAEPAEGEDLCLHEMFALQARRTPEAPALVTAGETLTYRELAEQSGRLAARLRRLGVGPEVRVALCSERTPEMVVGLLAVLEAGGAYVPLDPAYPEQRLAWTLADSGAAVLLTRENLLDRLPAGGARVVLLETAAEEEGEAPEEAVAPRSGPRNLAYVIYTSGSTGLPKGVAIEHRSAAALVHWARRAFSAEERAAVLASTSICFDLSVFELFVPLCSGGRVVLAANALELPALAGAGVTLVNTVPSAAAELARGEGLPPSVRVVNLAGEPLQRWLVDRLHERLPGCRVLNLYGPSEDTTYSTGAEALAEDRREPAIGRPLPGTRSWVLDAHLAPVPAGVAGELYLGGAGLARGYLGRPELTAERFVPDPWSGDAGARLYRTGDLARWRADGELEFLGRADHQVKVRGFRIELGEVEAALAQHPEVREVAVGALPEPGGGLRRLRLVAWVAAEAPGIGREELAAFLAERLPGYMVPTGWSLLAALPRTPNGKLDRKALPVPGGGEEPGDRTVRVAPRTPLEELLAGLWSEVLGVEAVGVHDRFFDLGGHSLLATRVVSRLRQSLGVEIPLRRLFEAPTVAALAREVEAARASGAAVELPPLRPLPPLPPLPPTVHDGAPRLSFAQERLWFLYQLEPDSPAYNLPAAVRLSGPLDAAALRAAVAAVARRHEALRTTFGLGPEGPVQVILPSTVPPLPILDLGAVAAAEREALARDLAVEEARRPFDLERGPLFRLVLLRLGAEEHLALLTLHHAVADGWSIDLFWREAAALYEAFAAGRPAALPELPAQYADFAVWQRGWLSGDLLEAQLAYWRRQLAGLEVLELPADRPRPAVPSRRGITRRLHLAGEVARELTALARRQGATPFMVLTAAFHVLLERYSGRDDVAVGTPVANRNVAELEPLVGFFANTLVLRADLAGDPAFGEVLGRVRAAALDAYAHQDVPFERLVEELQPRRSLAHNPFFEVMLVLEGAAPVRRAGALELRPEAVDTGAAKFDATLLAVAGAGSLDLVLQQSADLFDAVTTERTLGRFAVLLAGIVEGPERRLSELPLLAEAERRQLAEWQGPEALPPGAFRLHDRFAEQARRNPGEPAVLFQGGVMTYGELDRRANGLAWQLRALGVGPEVPVAICAERSFEMVVALLGVLKAGGAYVPMDPAYPRQHMALVLEDSRPAVVLTQERLLERLPETAGYGAGHVLTLDSVSSAGLEAETPPGGAEPDNLAYVIFTSGSTGRPKGVAIRHASAVALVDWAARAFAPAELETVLASTSICFDLSVFELFVPLSLGGRVALAANALELPTLPEAPLITLINTVPSAAAALLRMGGLPAGVRTVCLAGEPLTAALAAQLHGASGARLLDLYGPSEDTTYSTGEEVARDGGTPTIGRPLPGTRAHVVDARLTLAAPGVPGELLIGGTGLARGYLGRPELTAQRFVPDPFGHLFGNEPGARLYRTGDLVRHLPDGRLQFLGRIDHQVKVRGFRIELGEVEAALAAHPGVEQAVVLARQDSSGDGRLIAYVVPGEARPAAADLARHLRERLPEHMVPSVFVPLEALPLTPNGKVDRRALPAPEAAALEPSAEQAAPESAAEELLAALWADVLGVEHVGRADDFFTLGGHSLLATRLVARVRDTWGVDLPLRAVFEAHGLAALAARIEASYAGSAAADEPPLAPRPRAGALPLSFAQERLWLLDRLDPGVPLYNIPLAVRLEGRLEAAALERALAEVLRRHEALRARFAAAEPLQEIAPPAALELPAVDLGGLPAARRDGEARRLAALEAARPFDLASGRLLRAVLLRLEDEEHLALLTLHHLAGDGWSVGVLFRELAELYAGFAAGRPSSLPELPLQYADFALWQREWMEGEAIRQLSYWQQRHAGPPPVLRLPTDRPRPAVQSHRGAVRPLPLPAELAERLPVFARRQGATLFMVLLAALETVLHRYTGQADFAIGTPIANRTRTAVEPLIGLFVNTLVLRADIVGEDGAEPTFHALLERVRETALGAYAHQDLPFEKLVEALDPERDLSHSPLFQVLLVLQNVPQPRLALPGLRSTLLEVDGGTAKFDLTFTFHALGGSLEGSVELATELFDAATVDRLGRHLAVLLAGAAVHPEARLGDLPLLTAAECQQVLEEWNATGEVLADGALLHGLVAEQAARTPDAVALVDGEAYLTYAELTGRAARLARRLRALGAGPEVPVAVCGARSARLVTGLLAVLEAGAAYLPLDPAYPRERTATILAESGAPLLLTEAALVPVLPATSARLVDLAGPDGGEDGEPESAAGAPVAGSLAYVIYTSGSTGRPKGVAIEHRSAVALVRWAWDLFPPEDLAGVLASTSICFDLSVFELFVPLARGGTVILAENALELPGLPAAGAVTLVNTVPSAIAELVRHGSLPAGVRTVSLAGEALQGGLAQQVYRVPGVRRVLNLYGPSEDTTYSTWAVAERGSVRPVPIGRPVTGTRAYLVDAGLRPVPPGAAGELCLGGAGLARGYLGRPELTAERWVPDPFGGAPGGRLYRTGDLARHLPGGDLEFLGRVDHQVKVRGFRIELGEVEAALASHPAVRQAAVLVREDGHGGKSLAAYAAVDPAAAAGAEELRGFLRGKLPEYMVPSLFALLDALPLTPNGKVDRRALPELQAAMATSSSAARAGAAPGETSPVAELLAEVWAEVLDVERVGPRDNFFELGGHSLAAARLVSRLRQVFGVELPLRLVFQAPTVAALARAVEAARGGDPAEALTALAGHEDCVALSFAQERLWVLDQLEPGAATYNMPGGLRLRGGLDAAALARALSLVTARHDALRTAFHASSEGPLQLVLPALAVPLPVVDLAALPAAAAQGETALLAAREAGAPFDLRVPPLLRATLLRLAADEHVLLLTLHHIVCDGWSLHVLVRELSQVYTALLRGEEERLQPLPLQYPQFAVWQRSRLQGERLEALLAYWRGALAGEPPTLDLPLDRPRPAVQSYRGARCSLGLGAELSRRLRALGRREGATLFMTLLAAFQVLLHRLSGQDDVLVGTPVAGRSRAEVEGLIGCFVNTLVLRGDLSGDPSFRELLGRVREAALGAYAHQDLPFERLLEEVRPERDLSRTPLFQVFLNMLPAMEEEIALPGVRATFLPAPEMPAKFDLTLYVRDERGVVALDLAYNADLFDRARMEHLLEQLEQILALAAEAPEERIGQLPLVTRAAQAVLPDPAARLEPVWDGPVHRRVVERARQAPDRVALVDATGAWTYGDLEARSAAVAAALWQGGIRPGDCVAVWGHRSAPLAWAVLGVLRAGAAFLILDPAYPPARLVQCLELAGPRGWIGVAAAGSPPPELEPFRVRGVRLEAGAGEPAVAAAGPVAGLDEPAVGPEDLAYLAFTSGSTGRPKAILGPHAPLPHFLDWHRGTFGLGEADHFSLLSGLAHDPLLRDLFTPLWSGGTLCIPAEETFREPAELVRWLAEREVSVAHLTPALGRLLAAAGSGPSTLPALRRAFFGGETLTGEAVARLRRLAPGLRAVNYYGATETPQGMGWYEVPAEAGPGPVPLGRGIEGVQLLLRNRAGLPAGVGELAEIQIRSPYLALGYLGDEALTAERFLLAPPTGEPGDRVYRTGDLGRYLPDGDVQFAGRLDEQVKVRGFRVEPGEIEAMARLCPGVRETAALAYQDEAGETFVAVYAVVAPGGPSSFGLRRFLAERLPAYMVPAAVQILDALPLTPNGKLDRRALPVPGRSRSGVEHPYVPPATPLEERLAEIWARVLVADRVGRDDDFFQLGGHSLAATRMIALVREAFGAELSLRSLFDTPTLAGCAAVLAARLEGERGGAALPPVLTPAPADRHLPFPLTEIQQAYWIGRSGGIELGGVASHRYLEIECHDLDLERFAAAWRRLVDRHDMLRAVVLTDGRQRVLETVPSYEIETADVRGEPADGVAAHLDELRRVMSHKVPDPTRWPLFELRATRLGERRYRLHLSFDYLIADAWSFQILLRELNLLYAEPAALLPPLEVSFRDYVLAEVALQESELYAASLQHWRERLASLPPAPELPYAHGTAALDHPRFVRRTARLEAERWGRLRGRAARSGLTPSGLLLAAFSEVLAAWSKSPRFTVVLTIFNRLPFHPQVNDLLGDFTSTTLLAVDTSRRDAFQERARRLQQRLWEDLDHRAVGGVRVMRELARLQGQYASAAMPIVFTSTLNLRGSGGEGMAELRLPGEVVFGISQTPQVLLDHQVAEHAGALILNWDAVEEAFPSGLLDDMFQAYGELLVRLADGGDAAWLEPPPALVPEWQVAVRTAVNATEDEVPAGLLHAAFAERAAREPGRVAIVAADAGYPGGRRMTYGELYHRAAVLGHALRELGARPNTLVAIAMEKGWEQAAAALGVLFAGAAYLPVDPGLPAERFRYLLEHGEVDIALTQPWLLERLEWPERVYPIPVTGDAPPEAVEPPAPHPAFQAPEDLAYVIFTSGSTGLPKGVMIDHRGALNTVVDVNRRFRVGPEDRVLALSALNFDLSVYDLFGVLGAGGTVVLPDPSAAREPARWLELVEREEVTVWNSVPALMEMFADYLAGLSAALPRSLRLALLSGDWIPLSLPRRLREMSRGLEVVSLGGATEASIWSILYPVEHDDPAWRSIPYGRPMVNQRFQVLDDALEPRPVWVPGHLYIAGTGLAKGYWRDEEKTAASFVTHPRLGERLYRTGDLGRYLPDGTIEFLGREDFQVKVQGYRIELGEVEAALVRHPAVQAVVAAALGERMGEKRLVAYVVADAAHRPTPEELRSFLEGRIPAYMVPSAFVALDELPLGPNGKVDRKALPAPEMAMAARTAGQEHVAPRTPVEETLAGMFAEILEVETVGIHDHFFAGGGNSLKAMLLISRVREAFEVELPLGRLFEQPTVAELALAILEQQGSQVQGDEMEQMLAELEGLSEEEIRSLLASEAE